MEHRRAPGKGDKRWLVGHFSGLLAWVTECLRGLAVLCYHLRIRPEAGFRPSSRMESIMKRSISVVVTALALANFAYACQAAAPEIDASAGVAAIALLAGGLLILRARRKKKD